MPVFRSARVVGVAAAVVVCAAAACSKSPAAQARTNDGAPTSVQVQEVREDVVRRSVDVVGTLAAADEVVVSSEADGTVSRILADLGDRVRAGQPLVELDREKPQYSLDQQRAALATRARQVRRRRTRKPAANRADARGAESGGGAAAGEAGA